MESSEYLINYKLFQITQAEICAQQSSLGVIGAHFVAETIYHKKPDVIVQLIPVAIMDIPCIGY